MTAMSKGKNFVPKLRHHKASGQLYAVFNEKVVYFGKIDDPQSNQNYHEFVAEWMALGEIDVYETFYPEGYPDYRVNNVDVMLKCSVRQIGFKRLV